MNHVMIAVEAMGKKTTAPLMVVGAVFFDPATCSLGAQFYTRVDIESCLIKGTIPEGDAIEYCLRLGSDERAKLISDENPNLWDAGGKFYDWLTANADDLATLGAWSGKPSIEFSILRRSFSLSFDGIPWPRGKEWGSDGIIALGMHFGLEPLSTYQRSDIEHAIALDRAINQVHLLFAAQRAIAQGGQL
ncbi:ATPase [Candidatus Symbiopectobacterium sp. 'North America']|uniref:3'-5' exonuclease n=1 Tax=Candidatus Symbiopectobacterium sp. 'North America' TaxID=2794574 RepID=UPI0018CA8547|nr:3'-5' exonuclease [Candidatus Symbiopectobacterium sp. 'North America']MBG6244012.1 ATPase [Candidatus Symbiopectobacterium sp. 'North America']